MLVVGLGNPGEEYEKTRHNMGFLVVRTFADRYTISLKHERKFKGWAGRGRVGSEQVHLLLPATYMNESGQAVRAYTDFYQIPPSKVLVVTDDVALAFGQMRLREKGSAGGHNGLKSIQSLLGTTEYPRLRVGIGRRAEGGNLVPHVLGKFNAAEAEQLPKVLEAAAEVISQTLVEPLQDVMKDANVGQSKGEIVNE